MVQYAPWFGAISGGAEWLRSVWADILQVTMTVLYVILVTYQGPIPY